MSRPEKTSGVGAHDTSVDLQESLTSHPKQFRFELGDRIAGGAEGDVFALKLFQHGEHGNVKVHDCVAKRIKREKHDSDTTPGEFSLLEALTNDMTSSAEAGVIRHIGLYKHTDACPYETMLKYDFSFEKCFPVLPDLLKTQRLEDIALFAGVTIKFLNAVVNALELFSRKKVVHGDMKPDNFLFREGYFVVTDFGSAQYYPDFRMTNQATRGTPAYLAPEILRDERNLSSAADLWSVGQMLRRLLGLELLYHRGEREQTVYAKGSAYDEERKKSQNDNSKNSKVMVYHQKRLRNKILNCTDFKACLTYLSDILCELLPERRANLETLRIAFTRLKSLQPVISDRYAEACFYCDIMTSALRHAQNSVISDCCWDNFSNSDVPDGDSSKSLSPIPTQSPFPGEEVNTGRSPDSDYPSPEKLLDTAKNCHRFLPLQNTSAPITRKSSPARLGAATR